MHRVPVQQPARPHAHTLHAPCACAAPHTAACGACMFEHPLAPDVLSNPSGAGVASSHAPPSAIPHLPAAGACTRCVLLTGRAAVFSACIPRLYSAPTFCTRTSTGCTSAASCGPTASSTATIAENAYAAAACVVWMMRDQACPFNPGAEIGRAPWVSNPPIPALSPCATRNLFLLGERGADAQVPHRARLVLVVVFLASIGSDMQVSLHSSHILSQASWGRS